MRVSMDEDQGLVPAGPRTWRLDKGHVGAVVLARHYDNSDDGPGVPTRTSFAL